MLQILINSTNILEKDEGDPIEAPPARHSKIQPDYQVQTNNNKQQQTIITNDKGRLVWISGAPGLGKSTTAQLLGRHHGFVYYEVDCFDDIRNPYFSLDTHSSMSHVRRKKNDKHNL